MTRQAAARRGGAARSPRSRCPAAAPPTGSSASRTCRSRAGCSPGPRRSCWSCRSSGSPRCGRRRGSQESRERAVVGASRARSRSLAGALGVALFARRRLRRARGRRRRAHGNLAPTRSTCSSGSGSRSSRVLFGDVFRAFNPWRAIAPRRWAGSTRRVGGPTPRAAPLPERLGRWPAVPGILGFAWVELVYVNRTTRARWRSWRSPTPPCSSSA